MPREAISRTRRVQRARHEIRQREVEVIQVEPVSPHFVSFTFGGESLADFISPSFDDHIRFMFVDETGELVRRDYTPRRFDPQNRELTIEFGLHRGGRASDWASRAISVQRVPIGGPRGSLIILMDYDWHLLAGDAASWPAIHRRLEELPVSACAKVLVTARPCRRPPGVQSCGASGGSVGFHPGRACCERERNAAAFRRRFRLVRGRGLDNDPPTALSAQ